MDAGGSKWWFLAEPHGVSKIVDLSGGSTLIQVVDPRFGYCWIYVVEHGGSRWLIIVDPGG